MAKSLYEALRTACGHYKIFLTTNMKKGLFYCVRKAQYRQKCHSYLVQSHFHGTGVSIFEYPELNLEKTEQQQWSQQFSSFVDSSKSWAQYYIEEKCIQPRNIKETNSFLTSSLMCTSYTSFFIWKIGTCSKSRWLNS